MALHDILTPSLPNFAHGYLVRKSLNANGTLTDEAIQGTNRPEQPGRAIYGDGTNYVALSNETATTHTSSFSLSCWFNLTAINSTALTALMGTAIWNSSTFGVNLGVNTNTRNLALYYFRGDGITTGQVNLTNAGTLTLNQWHHLVLTFDTLNLGLKLYQDKVLIQDLPIELATMAPGGSARLFNIGWWQSRFFKATKAFDYRHFSNRVLTQAEINDLNVFKPVANTTAWHKLDTAGGNTEFDCSGNNRHATIIGPVASTYYTGPDVPHSFQNEVGYGRRIVVNFKPKDFKPNSVNLTALPATVGFNNVLNAGKTLADGTTISGYYTDGNGEHILAVGWTQAESGFPKIDVSGSIVFTLWANCAINVTLIDASLNAQMQALKTKYVLVNSAPDTFLAWYNDAARTAAEKLEINTLFISRGGVDFPTYYNLLPGTWKVLTSATPWELRYVKQFAANTFHVDQKVNAVEAVVRGLSLTGITSVTYGNAGVVDTTYSAYHAMRLYRMDVYDVGFAPRDESNPLFDIFGKRLEYAGKAPVTVKPKGSHAGWFNGTHDVATNLRHDFIFQTAQFEIEFFASFEKQNATTFSIVFLSKLDGTGASNGFRLLYSNKYGADTTVHNQLAMLINGSAQRSISFSPVGVNHYRIKGFGNKILMYMNGVDITNYSNLIVPEAPLAGAGSGYSSFFGSVDSVGGGGSTHRHVGLLAGFKLRDNNGTLVLNDPFSEGGGNIIHNKAGVVHGSLIGDPEVFWSKTQDMFHHNLTEGFSGGVVIPLTEFTASYSSDWTFDAATGRITANILTTGGGENHFVLRLPEGHLWRKVGASYKISFFVNSVDYGNLDYIVLFANGRTTIRRANSPNGLGQKEITFTFSLGVAGTNAWAIELAWEFTSFVRSVDISNFTVTMATKYPAKNATHDVLNTPLTHPASPSWYNYPETALDFSGGIASPDSLKVATNWKGEAHPSLLFRKRGDKADRFLVNPVPATGQKLLSQKAFTQNL